MRAEIDLRAPAAYTLTVFDLADEAVIDWAAAYSLLIDRIGWGFAFYSYNLEKSMSVALGQFNRRENEKTQPKSLALSQVASGEVWGRTPRNGFEPAVQAYAGKLKNQRGIDFTTLIDPHPGSSPLEVRWYLTKTPGVEYRRKDGEDFACIKAVVTNMQP